MCCHNILNVMVTSQPGSGPTRCRGVGLEQPFTTRNSHTTVLIHFLYVYILLIYCDILGLNYFYPHMLQGNTGWIPHTTRFYLLTVLEAETTISEFVQSY